MGGRTKARVKTPSPDRPLKPIKDGEREHGKGYLGIEGVTSDYKKQVRNNKISRSTAYNMIVMMIIVMMMVFCFSLVWNCQIGWELGGVRRRWWMGAMKQV